jgi:subtilisin family serine protease
MRRVNLWLGLVGIAVLMLPAAAASAAVTAAGTTAAVTAPGPTGNVLVLLDRDGAQAASGQIAVHAQIASAGGRVAGVSVPQIGLITLRPPLGVSIAAFERRLMALPDVASVQPEERYVARDVPNDPALTTSSPYSGVVQWALAREGFYDAWNISKGNGALVGIVDTGVDAKQPDLQDKIAAAVNQQQPADATGTAHTDEDGHGTNVASLACADTNNGIGMAGAGYSCKLVVEKSDFTDSSIAASIVDATDRGVQAINMSFGPENPTSAPAPASEVRALDYAAAHKVVLVAAAADTPTTEQGDPANVVQPLGTGPQLSDGIGLDVTAADYDNARASWAGSGSEISLAAYGAFIPADAQSGLGLFGIGPPPGIFGAFPTNSTQMEALPDPCGCRTTFEGSSDYAYLQGTSMAAPQVAAVGAMMRAMNPYATLTEILTTIKHTATRPVGTGWSDDLGWGILNADAALEATPSLDGLAPVAQLYAPRVTSKRTFALHWRGHDQQRAGLVASGIAYYDVYLVESNKRERLLARTTRQVHKLTFKGRRGHRYSFLVIAVDHAGNRSSVATKARASTRVKP